MSYPNMTNITQAGVNDFTSFFSLGNDLSNGLFGVGMSFVFYVVIVTILTSRWGNTPGIVAGSFIAFLFNLLLLYMELITPYFASLPAVVLGITMFIGFTKA